MKSINGIGKLLICSTVAFLAGGAMTGTAGAGAASYTVHTCQTPNGGWAEVGGWHLTEGRFKSIDHTSDSCPDGPFQMWMSDRKRHPSDDFMRASFRAPADTQIVGYSFWRSVQLASPYHYRYYEHINGEYVPHDECFADSGCKGRGSASQRLGSTNLVQASGRSGVDGLLFSITCGQADSSGTPCPARSPGARFQLHRADVTLEDKLDPVLTSPPSGPVVDPSKPLLAGLVPVSLSAQDRGGGVYEALFEVDGQVVDHRVIDPNDGECRPPFENAVPCKQSVSDTVPFNSATVPDGTHSLRIRVTDATGTNDAVYGPVTIRTANASCNPFPAAGGEQMRARFARHHGKGRRTITVPYGRRALVRGRVLSGSGSPLSHAGLCFAEQPKMLGGQIAPTGGLTTDARGHFAQRIGRGPSRTLYFVRRVPGGAVSSTLNLKVRAPVKLNRHRGTVRNGQTLIFRGGLGERTFATSGLLVELQAQRGRRHFQTFGVTHTNNRGRFRFPYTFTRTAGVQHYHLRAQVPAQRIYPFATGWSHPITVRVVGPGS